MHPLEAIMAEEAPVLLIGDSSNDRFPGFSYDAYTRAGKAFHCFDLGGLSASRGPTKGGVVHTRVDALPEGRGDLAIIWVTPDRVEDALDVAEQAGIRRIWFSFGTAGRRAVAAAETRGFELVEVGRCPVYYLRDKPPLCAAHAGLARLSGTRGRAPNTAHRPKLRVMW